jgi:aspartate/tyrosine/aromatic aminotransferase
MASHFAELTPAPPIEVFELTASFNADSHPKKVNLGVGGNECNIETNYAIV